LPCFDLSTEFHLFAEEYRRRRRTAASSSIAEATGAEVHTASNCWIVKPAQGARGIGHVIVASGDKMGLQRIGKTCPMIELEYQEGNIVGVNAFRQKPVDRIAQLLVTRPLLVLKRKFDLRLYVFVRSFVPFDGTIFTFSLIYLLTDMYNI